MNDRIKVSSRVRYIGDTWTDRKGWEGTIMHTNHPDLCEVRFDLLPSQNIRVYFSSLELIK